MHLNVVLDGGAEHRDEISLTGRAEGDDHSPYVVMLQDPVQLAHVTEHGGRQAPSRHRVEEPDRIDAEVAVFPEDSGGSAPISPAPRITVGSSSTPRQRRVRTTANEIARPTTMRTTLASAARSSESAPPASNTTRNEERESESEPAHEPGGLVERSQRNADAVRWDTVSVTSATTRNQRKGRHPRDRDRDDEGDAVDEEEHRRRDPSRRGLYVRDGRERVMFAMPMGGRTGAGVE